MAALSRNSRALARRHAGCAAAAAIVTLLAAGAAARNVNAEDVNTPDARGSFAWSADVLSSDFRSDTLDLSGNVRVTQGPMSIEAGTATARDFRSDDSRWTFQQAVHIRTAEADLHSDSASARFVNGQLADARIEGSPAQFAQRGGETEGQVRGRAGVIEYDFGAGIVKLTNQVWFSNGKDEFRGDVVIYDVRDERVQINPGGRPSGRVRGIIRPREQPDARPDAGRKSPDARGTFADPDATAAQRSASESGA